jgi:hypothetical protein
MGWYANQLSVSVQYAVLSRSSCCGTNDQMGLLVYLGHLRSFLFPIFDHILHDTQKINPQVPYSQRACNQDSVLTCLRELSSGHTFLQPSSRSLCQSYRLMLTPTVGQGDVLLVDTLALYDPDVTIRHLNSRVYYTGRHPAVVVRQIVAVWVQRLAFANPFLYLLEGFLCTRVVDESTLLSEG